MSSIVDKHGVGVTDADSGSNGYGLKQKFLSNDNLDSSTTTTKSDITSGTGTAEAPSLYDVEHLATFSTVSSHERTDAHPNNGHPASKSKFKQTNDASSATEPKVALAKLFELEKLSGIWTQRMQIELKQDFMLILDCETNSIVERFHRDRITKPEAFNHYNDIYSNIIVFIIKHQQRAASYPSDQENCDRPSGELHIFQCMSHKAKQLVEDILEWKRLSRVGSASNDNPDESKKDLPTTTSVDPKSGSDSNRALRLFGNQNVTSRELTEGAQTGPLANVHQDDKKSQDMKNEVGSQAQKIQQSSGSPEDSQRLKPAVTVASCSGANENVPIVNVNVKETVQVFNQIAALREKSSGVTSQAARPLSDASSSSQSAQGANSQSTASVGGAALSAGGQFYKQRSIRVTLAPKESTANDGVVAASAASPNRNAINQIHPESSSSSCNASSSLTSSSSASNQQHQKEHADASKRNAGERSTPTISTNQSSYSSQKQIACQQQSTAKTANSNNHTQSSLLSDHPHTHQHPRHQQAQPPFGKSKSSGGGNNTNSTNKLSSSSSSSSSRPPASNGHHYHSSSHQHRHFHGGPRTGAACGPHSSDSSGRSGNSPPPPPLMEPGKVQHQMLEQVNTNESYVSVLNHCFDDIEKFIIRLQHAFAAVRELQAHKKSSRRSSTTALAGAGASAQASKSHSARNGGAPLPPLPPPLAAPELAMLSSKARGPSANDFFEILSKFKLAFNLLAKLKGCIHEPNAPELVHFLFTPLAIIIESARNVAPPVDPALVSIPYLNRDALDLLSNCCTSKESDLWLSLGSNWTQTIDAQVLRASRLPSSFQPVFSDGWAPVISELELIGLVLPPASPSDETTEAHYQQAHNGRVASASQPPDEPLMARDSRKLPCSRSNLQLVELNGKSSALDNGNAAGGGGSCSKANKKRITPKDSRRYMDPNSQIGGYAPGYNHQLEPAIVEDPLGALVDPYRAPELSGAGVVRQSRSAVAARMPLPISERTRRTGSHGKYASNGTGSRGNSDYPTYGHYAPPLGHRALEPIEHYGSKAGAGYSSYVTNPSDDYTEVRDSTHTSSALYLPPGSSGGAYMSGGHSRRRGPRDPSAGYEQSGFPAPARQLAGYDHEDLNHDNLIMSEAEHEAMLLDIGPSQTEWFYELKSRGALTVRVLFTRDANNDKELTVRRGEILEILDDTRKWWKARNIDLQVAYVPHTIVAVMEHYQTLDELLTNSPGGMMMMVGNDDPAIRAQDQGLHSRTAKGAFRYF